MIKSVKLHNFKKFKDITIDFQKNRNILIGENGVGKSSILLAISTVLSGSFSMIEKIGLQKLFNIEVVEKYMKGSKKYEDLPFVEVEVFLDDAIDNFDINGKNNSLGRELNGLKMVIHPNDEYSDVIRESLEQTNIFPFEYYSIDFRTFADKQYNSYRKYANYISYSYLDSSKVNSSFAMKDYINKVYEGKTDRATRFKINNSYRDSAQKFSDKLYSEFSLPKINDLKIKLNTSQGNMFQEHITVEKAGVQIENFGQGEKIFINTDFLLSNNSNKNDIVLIEEPENHLSHVNMHKLIDKIIATGIQKQTFIATHSNMITSRLDLQNAIFISEDSKVTKLHDLKADTAKFFEKAPDNNVLNFILAKKVILVEGDAEYILLNEFFKYLVGEESYKKDITIISCGGKTFKRYLEIAILLNKKVAVITDNDHNYDINIEKSYADYQNDRIQVFADEDNSNHTFEVCLYNNNFEYIEAHIAKPQMSNGVLNYMLNNKAEAAFRLLCLLVEESQDYSINHFNIPEYIKAAIGWISE